MRRTQERGATGHGGVGRVALQMHTLMKDDLRGRGAISSIEHDIAPTSVSGLYVFAELSLTSCPGRIPDDCFRDVYRTTLMRKHARAILAYRITYDTQKAEPSETSAREHATTDER